MPKHLRDVTAAEWFACSFPGTMLAWLTTADARKLRLFAVAACRAEWDHLSDPARGMVAAAERWADGDITRAELATVRGPLEALLPRNTLGQSAGLDAAAVRTATPRKDALDGLIFDLNAGAGRRDPHGVLPNARWAAILHDIFDGQFYALPPPAGAFTELAHPVAVRPEWRTYNAVGVAHAIYTDRAFGRMPVLADALEDAGCDVPEVLEHCRGPGPHARGCWVVDQVLGRE